VRKKERWLCATLQESGEHMPEKERFVGELCRVCAPGRVRVGTRLGVAGWRVNDGAGKRACRLAELSVSLCYSLWTRVTGPHGKSRLVVSPQPVPEAVVKAGKSASYTSTSLW